MATTIGLIGNPNCGKSTLFNALTGLNQKVGNFPGVTVDRKIAKIKWDDKPFELIDFPGTYSLYPNAQDEQMVVATLCNKQDPSYPDSIIYVADINQLEKHFLLLSQVLDLKIPCVLALNMADEEEPSSRIDIDKLSKWIGIPTIKISARKQENLEQLKKETLTVINQPESGISDKTFGQQSAAKLPEVISEALNLKNKYRKHLIAQHADWLPMLTQAQRDSIEAKLSKEDYDKLGIQVEETLARFDLFAPKIKSFHQADPSTKPTLSDKADRLLTHFIAGPIIFAFVLLFIFQAIFSWSGIPMGWIESLFAEMRGLAAFTLGSGWLLSLVNDGLLAGLEGVLIFIPQIALLFFLIGLLEESGYMSRAVYLFDGMMSRFGMNGRSIVALVSSGACAIPAIMSTRTISNWKERLITIMVSPFISCSARIPVYAVLVAFVVPATSYGIFNLQGLVFLGLYVLGVVAALLAAWVFKKILKSNQRSFLLLELPPYRWPSLRNVFTTVLQKLWTFIWEAGRIILVISILLWLLASFSIGDRMDTAEKAAYATAQSQNLSEQERENLVASNRLEASFAGMLGKTIEPLIAPLGMDWKMGIALITSFAAREVFVGTMGTIYSLGEADELSLREHMAKEINPKTGGLRYDVATSLSLLIFYVFAMQCMSTLAVVRRETNSWKWPIIQFVFMGVTAYLGSLIVYQLFS